MKLDCRTIDHTGVVKVNDHETLGYNYRDTIEQVKPHRFTYVATNPQTQFSIGDS